MGFIKAFQGAIQQTFADQWKDFYMPIQNVPATAGLFPAVARSTNAGVGENYKGAENIITDGSKIIVPEGTALITVQDGAVTGFIAEAGGYEFRSNDPNSQSVFSGNGILASTIGQSWERFKFGGQPSTQQLAFYVNLKQILGNRFGTQTPIYWQDEFLATKAGCSVRGTYALQIVDPMLFFKSFVPDVYKQPNGPIFDFADFDNTAGDHLFNQFITCLTSAFKRFSMQSKQNGMDTLDYVQANTDLFAKTMDEEVERTYNWTSQYGLKVTSVNLQADYDTATLEILEEARKADQEIRKATRMGAAYSNNMAGMMAAASGQAMQAAASNENGAMMGFMGMNMAQQNGVNMMGAVNNMQPQQPVEPQPQVSAAPQAQVDPTTKLLEMKKLLDAGAISQEEYDAVKAKILGL